MRGAASPLPPLAEKNEREVASLAVATLPLAYLIVTHAALDAATAVSELVKGISQIPGR